MTALVTDQDEAALAGPRWPPNAVYAEDGAVELSLVDANLTLDARRDSLRAAARIVALCPDAGEAVDLAELAAGFERAAERAFVLDRNVGEP